MSFAVHSQILAFCRQTSVSKCSCLLWPQSESSSSCPLGSSKLFASRFWNPSLLVVCSSAEDGEASPPAKKKGFGKPAVEPKKRGAPKGLEQKSVLLNQGKRAAAARKQGSSQLSKVVDVVDRKSSGGSSIDPSQAKLGKVDFVRVQNWGSDDEDSPKLEDLKVKSFSPAATSAQNGNKGPFYEKLVNRLQLLESKGEITVAQSRPVPSFDRWMFGENRYLQFLVDQLLVFEALRDGIASIRKERCEIVAEKLEEVVPLGGAASAVGLFDEELGLDRCKALSEDILSILKSSVDKRESGLASLTASTQAVAYAKYLRQLGKRSLADGMRIGAKAMDNVASVRQSKAFNFYNDYPLVGQQGKDPLKLFIKTINSAGSFIDLDDDHEQVMEELSKAFQRTSLMLSVLAVEEQVLVVVD